MDYIILIQPFIILTFLSLFFSIFLYFFLRIKNHLKETKIYYKNCIYDDINEFSQDMIEIIEDLQSEINNINAHLFSIRQDSISWVTASKELPAVAKLVLLLDKEKNELHGYLNMGAESWTITSLGSPLQHFSVEKISHWKPIFHL